MRLFSQKSIASTGELPIPVTDPCLLEELLSLNRGDVSFILGDPHSILNTSDTRRNSSVRTRNLRTLDTGVRILRISLLISSRTDYAQTEISSI